MTARTRRPRGSLPLYVTGSHPCSYLPEPTAHTLFVDPRAPMDGPTYEMLLSHGFRRSGTHVYRPACEKCQACVPVRLPVKDFAPNRAQRRNRTRNAPEVTLVERPAVFEAEHYALYRAYVQSRHADGSMAEASEEGYRDFLLSDWGGETLLLELRLGQRLMAVAVSDLLPASLSAVYTFFDPGLSDRAPGTYAVLCQVAEARRRGLAHLYLGYWIEDCRKMRYKDTYRPIEAMIAGQWRRFERGSPIGWREQG